MDPLIIMRDIDVVLFVARAGAVHAAPPSGRTIRQLRRGSEVDIYTVMTSTPRCEARVPIFLSL